MSFDTTLKEVITARAHYRVSRARKHRRPRTYSPGPRQLRRLSTRRLVRETFRTFDWADGNPARADRERLAAEFHRRNLANSGDVILAAGLGVTAGAAMVASAAMLASANADVAAQELAKDFSHDQEFVAAEEAVDQSVSVEDAISQDMAERGLDEAQEAFDEAVELTGPLENDAALASAPLTSENSVELTQQVDLQQPQQQSL